MCRSFAIASFVALLWSAGPALASTATEQAEGKRFYAIGAAEYRDGKFDAALDHFSRAYAADPVPGFLFNIGQCHRALKHWEEAALFFQRYLVLKPNTKTALDARVLLAEAEKALGRVVPAEEPAAAPPPAPVVIPAITLPLHTQEVQPAAIEQPVEGPSHTVSYVLGGTAIAGILAGVVGAVLIAALPSVPASNPQNAANRGNWGFYLLVSGGVALVGGGTGAVLAW